MLLPVPDFINIARMKVVPVTMLVMLVPVHALLRFPCAQLVIDRLDLLVTPGQAPSPHLHQILGGVSPKIIQERHMN